MSEEKTPEVEPNENGTTDNGTENGNGGRQLSYEELQAELAKVRREAAGKRVANKELESELADYRKWKESQMSELEKAQSKLTETNTQRMQDWQELAQFKFGLEAEDLEFLKGSTKEEILASAEKLATRLGRTSGNDNDSEDRSPRNPNLFPGTRGEPVGRGTSNANDLLREQLLGGR